MEEVIIPPVHSEEKKGEKYEKGFLKPGEELPAFEEHELDLSEKVSETKEKKKETQYEQLSYEVVHKVVKATCLVALVAWFVIIVLLTVVTGDNPFNVLVGLSPVLFTIIVTYILLDKYHLETGFLLVFPIIFTGIFYMLGLGKVFEGMDIPLLSSLNIIFGVLFIVVIIIHYGILRTRRKVKSVEKKEESIETKIEEKKEKKIIIKLEDEEGLKSFVSSIEDKSKAINAAIGRVYSVRHGGTEPLRKKIKIDAAHYNEFNELKHEEPEHRKPIAIKLLRKIKERLEVLQEPELQVFDNDDIESLLNLERNPEGEDKVIDVLITNDKDPIKAYYDGAMEFCNEALKQLGKE